MYIDTVFLYFSGLFVFQAKLDQIQSQETSFKVRMIRAMCLEKDTKKNS